MIIVIGSTYSLILVIGIFSAVCTWPLSKKNAPLLFHLFLHEQGQTVHKLQISNFWEPHKNQGPPPPGISWDPWDLFGTPRTIWGPKDLFETP